MTAYRLHSEPGTVAILEKIRRGEIGDPRIFSAVFGFSIGAANHRLDARHWGGPLQDVGVYCVNAARHVFGAEPTEAIAMKSHGADPRFAEVEEMLSATLRFPGGRMASFTVSFGAHDVDSYRVIGTEGEMTVEPGFRFEFAKRLRLVRGTTVTEEAFPDVDNFSGQAAYFSDCILNGERPEPDGAEGLADVAILRAIEAAATTGQAQKIDLPPRPGHPVPGMVREFAKTDRRLLL
jgi:predicted dehydrogenase